MTFQTFAQKLLTVVQKEANEQSISFSVQDLQRLKLYSEGDRGEGESLQSFTLRMEGPNYRGIQLSIKNPRFWIDRWPQISFQNPNWYDPAYVQLAIALAERLTEGVK